MPRKARITKEDVVEAAFGVAREQGGEGISARSVASRLGCSTQPVLYHFSTIEELRKAAHARADAYHTEYLLARAEDSPDPLLAIGLRFIRFAAEEPHLFRFLFQSGYAAGPSLQDIFEAEELGPVLSAMQEAMGTDATRTKAVFRTLALVVHGYASLLASNGISYDKDEISAHLRHVYAAEMLSLEAGHEKDI